MAVANEVDPRVGLKFVENRLGGGILACKYLGKRFVFLYGFYLSLRRWKTTVADDEEFKTFLECSGSSINERSERRDVRRGKVVDKVLVRKKIILHL